jgi:hypothetical protein
MRFANDPERTFAGFTQSLMLLGFQAAPGMAALPDAGEYDWTQSSARIEKRLPKVLLAEIKLRRRGKISHSKHPRQNV